MGPIFGPVLGSLIIGHTEELKDGIAAWHPLSEPPYRDFLEELFTVDSFPGLPS